MMNAQFGQFIPGNRMPRYNWRSQPECIEDPQIILGKPLFGITRFRPAGGSVPAARDSVNVVGVRQLLGEAIENMSAESESREQHYRRSRAAPIKYLQSNSVLDGYELHSVFRWIPPRQGFIPTREPQSRARALVHSLIVWFPQARLVRSGKLHPELSIRAQLHAFMAFVVLDFKGERLALHTRSQQGRWMPGARMPHSVGTAALLNVENSSAFNLSIGLFNLESDSGKVIHFPFPGSGERRVRRSCCWRLRDNRRRLVKRGGKCQPGDERCPVSFHVAFPYAVGPLASAAVARFPPRPMVSTAEEGTITIEPRSLMAS